MTHNQITVVKLSWQQIAHHSDAIAKHFYEKLFRYLPEIEPCLQNDYEAKGSKLIDFINHVITNLDNLSLTIPVCDELNNCDIGNIPQDELHDAISFAMLSTLDAALDDEFTSEIRESWTSIYLTLLCMLNQPDIQVA